MCLQVYKCYTVTHACAKKTGQSKAKGRQSRDENAAAMVMKFMKASCCSCFNPNRLRKCSGRSRAGLRATSRRDGTCIEVVQKVSEETPDAIRQIKNACGS